MKWLKTTLLALTIIPSLSLLSFAVLPSTPAAAKCVDSFLTFPAWYKGVQNPTTCEFQMKKTGGSNDFKATIIVIVLNAVNIILQLVGYVAAGMIIFGGYRYMRSLEDANMVAEAKKTIMNAVVGLAIAILSVAIVNLVAGLF